MADAALLRLMTWLSPAFPTGGFAWSAGLETACSSGKVCSKETLMDWLQTSLVQGALYNDAILLAQSHRHRKDIVLINDLALALASSKERFEETISLGNAFVQAAQPWRSNDAVELPDPIAYPVVVGAIAGENRIELQDTLTAWLQASVSAQIQAALRLFPLGQNGGVLVQKSMETAILETAEKAANASLDDLGNGALIMDIAVMKHETLSPRIFRS